MKVTELNRDQLTELKQRYYADATGRDLSYEELANIDFYVTDYDVQREYAHIDFVPDDFFCSAGEDEEDIHIYTISVNGDGNATRSMIASDLREIADAIENDYYSGLASYGSSWYIE